MTSPEEITVELMQRVLRAAKNDNSIVVISPLKVDELSEVQHFASVISRVKVRHTTGVDQSLDTLSIIVKFVPNSSNISIVTLFAREIQMYSEILPRMSTLLTKALPDHHTDFFPQGYFTQKIPNYVIALEDLAPKGFKAPKGKSGLDLNHCLLAFKVIARLHAASVIIHHEDESKSLFTVLDEYAFQEESLREQIRHTSNKCMLAMSQVVESWPEFGHKWGSRMRNRALTMHEDLMFVWKRDDGAFNVLNHGDFGVHNVMFRDSESSGEPEAIMLMDFQCCSYNSPVLDLHQFIFTNANNEVNVPHMETLMKEYHAELTSTLEALGAPREQTISLAELMQEFDNKMLFGFYYAVCVLPLFNIKAESDLSAGEMYNLACTDVKKFQSQLPDSYIKTLKMLLPIFSQKNVI